VCIDRCRGWYPHFQKKKRWEKSIGKQQGWPTQSCVVLASIRSGACCIYCYMSIVYFAYVCKSHMGQNKQYGVYVCLFFFCFWCVAPCICNTWGTTFSLVVQLLLHVEGLYSRKTSYLLRGRQSKFYSPHLREI
jgi:hypothetical protein